MNQKKREILGRAEWRRDLDETILEGRDWSLRKKSTGFKTGFTRVVRSNSTTWSECKGMCHEENRNVSAGFRGKTKNVTTRTTGRCVWSKNHREKHQLEATSADPSSRNSFNVQRDLLLFHKRRDCRRAVAFLSYLNNNLREFSDLWLHKRCAKALQPTGFF